MLLFWLDVFNDNLFILIVAIRKVYNELYRAGDK